MQPATTYTRPVLDYQTLKNGYHLQEELGRQILVGTVKTTAEIASLKFSDLQVNPYVVSSFIVENHPCKVVGISTLRKSLNINTPTPHWRLTPLHCAVMVDDLESARQLLEGGAYPDAKDHRGMTPLHHAGIIGNPAMIALLLHHGADVNAVDQRGATYKDYLKWTHLPEKVNDQFIRLYCQDGKGPKRLMAPQEYQTMTGSIYVEEKVYDPQYWIQQWVTPSTPDNPFIFEVEISEEFLRDKDAFPMNILRPVTHNCEGRSLSKSIGLGVFPSVTIQKKRCVGIYAGLCSMGEKKSRFTLEGGTDASQLSNEFTRVNDGFPNLGMINLRKGGHHAFFTIEDMTKVSAHTQYCWDYGFQLTKVLRYFELRPGALREFVKQFTLQQLITFFHIFVSRSQCSFEIFCIVKKFKYILHTPAVLFNMVVDETLDVKTAQAFLNFAIEHNPKLNGDDVLSTQVKQTVQIAAKLLMLAKKIKQLNPKAGEEVLDYNKTLMERVGLIGTVLICTVVPEFQSIVSELSSINTPLEALNGKTSLIAFMEKNAVEFSKSHERMEKLFG